MKMWNIFKKSENKRLEEHIVKIKISYAQYKKDILTIQDRIAKETGELYRIRKESAELIVIAEKAKKAGNVGDSVLALQRVESNEAIIQNKEAFVRDANKTFNDIFRRLEILGNEIGDIQSRTKEIEMRESINALQQTMKEDLNSISTQFDEALEQSEARLRAIETVRNMFD